MVLKFEPWGDEPILEWDEDTEEKFWHHNIRDFEIIECLRNKHETRPHSRAKSEPERYGDRFEVRGITDGGRKLIIFLQYKGANVIRPITGWDK